MSWEGTETIESDLPEEIRARVKPELAPGERLIWAGQPLSHHPERKPWPTTSIVWLCGLWTVSACCFLATLQISAEMVPAAVVFGLFSGVTGGFVALGVLTSVKNRRKEQIQRTKVVYALTDRRAIVWQPRVGSSATEVVTHLARSLSTISRTEYPDGSGDVIFNGVSTAYYRGAGFHGVADVRRVEALAREVLVNPEASRYRRRERAEDLDL